MPLSPCLCIFQSFIQPQNLKIERKHIVIITYLNNPGSITSFITPTINAMNKIKGMVINMRFFFIVISFSLIWSLESLGGYSKNSFGGQPVFIACITSDY